MKRVVALCVAIGALGIAGWLLKGLAKSKTFQVIGTLVDRVNTSERVVALTLDDGPAQEMVSDVLATLEAKQVKATFFATGEALHDSPESGRKIVAAGHELGNHTWSHQHMVFKWPSVIRNEIEFTDAQIRAAGQQGDIYVRPPYGWKLFGLPFYLWRHGRTSVTWDTPADIDASYVAGSSAARAADVAARVRPGSIILLHVWSPSHNASFQLLGPLIDVVRAKGYRFVTVRELLALR